MAEKASSKFIIDSNFIEPPEGLVVKNWVFDGEPLFKSKPRKKELTHFVLHETAGRTAQGCKSTLLKKGYGVHLILARSGIVSCHGDLKSDIMTHANQLNGTSIGIEVVNPYAPMIAQQMPVKSIPAQWWTWCPDKNDRRYILPSDQQLKALELLVPFLCEKLDIPYEFPTIGLNARNRKVKNWRFRGKPAPGVVAHRDFSKHADGRYLLEHLYRQSVSN